MGEGQKASLSFFWLRMVKNGGNVDDYSDYCGYLCRFNKMDGKGGGVKCLNLER